MKNLTALFHTQPISLALVATGDLWLPFRLSSDKLELAKNDICFPLHGQVDDLVSRRITDGEAALRHYDGIAHIKMFFSDEIMANRDSSAALWSAWWLGIVAWCSLGYGLLGEEWTSQLSGTVPEIRCNV